MVCSPLPMPAAWKPPEGDLGASCTESIPLSQPHLRARGVRHIVWLLQAAVQAQHAARLTSPLRLGMASDAQTGRRAGTAPFAACSPPNSKPVVKEGPRPGPPCRQPAGAGPRAASIHLLPSATGQMVTQDMSLQCQKGSVVLCRSATSSLSLS